jgi:hypothetical protein
MKRTGIRILAVVFVLAAVAVAPAMAQKVYTNRDLGDVQIPGAYTNKDVKFLEPIPTQKAPMVEPAPVACCAPSVDKGPKVDVRRAVATDVRDRLQAELDYELARIEKAYSPAGGGFTGSLRVGLKSKLEDRLEYLRREIALRDQELRQLP